jgi:hypothetical protein
MISDMSFIGQENETFKLYNTIEKKHFFHSLLYAKTIDVAL